MISSLANPRIKLIKSLGQKKFREKEKKFAAEGVHLVSEALNAPDLRIESIFFLKQLAKTPEGGEILRRAAKAGIELVEVSGPVMKAMSEVEEPQGIVAVIWQQDFIIDDLTSALNPLIVICAGIQDAGNLGTIVRSADACGCSGVLLGSGTVDVYNPKALRASMGSVFHLPIVSFPDVLVGMKRLREKGVRLIATSLQANEDFRLVDFKTPSAIVLGGEGAGLPADVIKACDQAVNIPMAGKTESLNVAVAGSILLYEAMRQRANAG